MTTPTDALLRRVSDRLADRADAATAPRVTVGSRVLLAEATHPDHGRLAGLAHCPQGEAGMESANAKSVADLADLATAAPAESVERAAGIAALNALSVPEVDWRVGDPMAALSADVETVATVGLFRPAFRKFDGVDVRVVERDPPKSVDAPPDVTVTTYSPADCEAAFDGADVCFVTGSTLVYGGIDRYLASLEAAGVAPVVLVGATASHVPEPAFAAGVDLVAGARVTDVERVRERVAAGDCGTDLHDSGVEKVFVAAGAGEDDGENRSVLAGLWDERKAKTDGSGARTARQANGRGNGRERGDEHEPERGDEHEREHGDRETDP